MTVITSPDVLTQDVLERCARRAPDYDRENRFFHEDFEELRSSGYLLMAVPVELGGLGLSLAEVCRETARLAYYAPATALATNMHVYWTGIAADLYRSGDRSLTWILEEAVAGEVFAAGHGESGNDLPVLLSTSKAERVDGGYRFTGHKMFGSLSPVWTRLGLHAMDTSDPANPMIVHAFMPRSTEGYVINETWDTLGMRATRSDDTVLDGAFVPDRYIARVVPAGFAGADMFVLGIFAWAEPTFASIYLSIARRALDLAVASLEKRTSIALGGATLAHHPMLQHTVAEMVMALDGATPHVEKTAADWSNGVDHGGLWPSKLVATKHHAVEAAQRVVDLAMEVSGGSGMFRSNELERLYRDVRCGGFHPANTALVHEIVGKTALGVLADPQRWSDLFRTEAASAVSVRTVRLGGTRRAFDGGGRALYARRVPNLDTPPPRPAAPGDEGTDSTPDSAPGSAGPTAKFRYEPALDGLRALAVLAIIAYPFDYSWARGAYLSVDLFFILSGFLITTLLITEWRRSDTVALRQFWARRARRLLPALLLLLVFVAIYTRLVIDPWNRAAVRGDGIASLFYVANWRFIVEKQGYFELFSAASPLRHMWTLAIEEQFYLVWPLVVFAVLRVSRGSLRALAAVCVAGSAVSIAVMAITYGPGDPLRAYYGTDTRAHTILIGALLAILLATWTPSAAARRRLLFAGIGAFVVMMYAWHVATGTSSRYYHGGSGAYAVLACVVIAGALQPGVLCTALGFRPLAWIGRLSYGLYVFHWPLIVWLVPTRVHLHGLPLNALRLAATFVAATLSFYLIEAPIRERRGLQWPGSRRASLERTPAARRSRPPVARWLALPAVGITLAIVFASSTGATAAPSYLSGTKTPSFTFPTIPRAPRASSPSTGPTGGDTTPHSPTSIATTAPVTFPEPALPTLKFIWNVGDPLFCGVPRASETNEAVDTARKAGPLALRGTAAGMRVLLLGDSTACSLYPGLKAVGDAAGASVAQAAVFGCGMASGEITTTRGEQITPHTERCPEMVQAAQAPAVAEMRPDVVIWMSLWEKSDMIVNGRTLISGTPEGDAEMLRRMDEDLARVTAYGAKVVLVTIAAPAPNEADGPAETAADVDGYARLDTLERRFAALHPAKVTLVDLARRLCPDGPPCPEKVDGVRMRPDGRHFTPTAAAIEARWLMQQVVATVHS